MENTTGNRLSVIGTGSWGTTLAILAASKGLPVILWARTEEEAESLRNHGENRRFLPGFRFPANLSVSSSLPEALSGCSLLLIAVPSQRVRHVAESIARTPAAGQAHPVVVSAAKGLEITTLLRMTEVLEQTLPPNLRGRVCALSGPNLSHEIALGKPATTVVASTNVSAAEEAQKLLITPRFRVYVNSDVVGVELGGALKNIIALGAGICDGLEIGDNGKASLITRGLAEIVRLAVPLGATPLTLYGLAGLGDMIATCSSTLSRNHYVGSQLGAGKTLSKITEAMDGVAEGIPTTAAAKSLCSKLGIEMPITEQMYKVLFEDKPPIEAITDLMVRQARRETE